MAATKASATVLYPWLAAPPKDQSQVWEAVRGQVSRPAPRQELDAKLVELVKRTDFTTHFEQTVILSYSMIAASQVDQLDKLWLDVMMLRTDSVRIAQFMKLRSGIQGEAVQDREYYLEHWLWNVKDKDKDKDKS